MPSAAKLNAWIRSKRTRSGVRLRLYCFPFAGAGASVFSAWAQSLPGEVEVLPVQLPGREERFHERPFLSVDTAVVELADALDDGMGECPIALFGHSMGALIAYELARRLQTKGAGPRALLVSGLVAPDKIKANRRHHLLPDDELIALLREMGGSSESVLSSPEMMEVMLPLIRNDVGIVETYQWRPEPQLDCDIWAFGGWDDRECRLADLEAWSHHTRGRCRVRLFEGGHFFISSSQRDVLSEISLALSGLTEPQSEALKQ